MFDILYGGVLLIAGLSVPVYYLYLIRKKPDMKMIYFTADWCSPCKQIKPKARKLAEDNGLEFTEVNIDSDPKLAAAYSVWSVPTIILPHDCSVILPAQMPWPKVKKLVEESVE